MEVSRPRRTSPKVLARHEAGHCVAAIAMGWRPRYVRIVDAADREGETAYYARRSVSMYDAGERLRRLVILFGGVEAERRVSHAPVFTTLTDAGAGDLDRICTILDESYGPWADAPPPFREMRDREQETARALARDVIRVHWPAVKAVSESLVQVRTLPGNELFQLAISAAPTLASAFQSARAARRHR